MCLEVCMHIPLMLKSLAGVKKKMPPPEYKKVSLEFYKKKVLVTS